ncbi:hypothetical Protein YC6258_03110 [Gynuella sunshinyii YC6258]|uniref:Uncharacterized protein n=1 Tax=Gynuella sunshinyii YC6258 TaxID=1445510 RepID=A0A0C5VLH2_9GAMM|nr:hypothetical Protein YC6258_03110 [Gynuella sunshinyii YC6258]
MLYHYFTALNTTDSRFFRLLLQSTLDEQFISFVVAYCHNTTLF